MKIKQRIALSKSRKNLPKSRIDFLKQRFEGKEFEREQVHKTIK